MKHRWPGWMAGIVLMGAAGHLWAERVVIDMAGRMVKIPDEIQRVLPVGHCMPLSLAIGPRQTAVINRIGPDFERFTPPLFREGKVGVGSASPEHIKDPSLPRLKGIQPPDVERAKPDLLFMEGNTQRAERADAVQKSFGIPVIVVDQDMHKYRQAFVLLGRTFRQEAQATKMFAYVQKRLAPIHAQTAAIPPANRVKFYYAHGNAGLNTEPEGNNHVQPLEYIHAANIFRAGVPLEKRNGTYTTTIEAVVRLDPDVILVASMGAEEHRTWNGMRNNPEWNKVRAFKEGRVYQVPWLPFSWLDRPPGSNRILGAVWLAKLLYPQHFESLDLEQAVREYFEVFFHKTLSDAEIKELLSLADLRTS